MKKILFLVFTLAIPVAIFLFLKIFGNNEFEVPILFENGIPECENSKAPHVVPEFEYIGETENSLSSQELEGYLVFGILHEKSIEDLKTKIIELTRIQDAFYEIGAPTFILLTDEKMQLKETFTKLATEVGLEKENYEIASMSHGFLMDFQSCGIALIDKGNGQSDNLTLVDPNRNIRGIYHTYDLEQTDQLILELKILKKA